MSGPTIPAQCDTLACLLNVARYLRQTDGLSPQGALYLAERILGIDEAADPSGIRRVAIQSLRQEATQ